MASSPEAATVRTEPTIADRDLGRYVAANPPAGALRGLCRDGLRIFKGIPYALPPTGNRRWKPPVPMPAWSGARDALDFGPVCPQPKRRPGSIYDYGPMPMDEDCLSLNVWAPEHADGAPVMVWIHGGSLIWGASREPMYDGEKLAARGIVVVSINYRLGVLGYLAHPRLSAESPHGISGNYGLLDQICALEWVRRNIASFGGDPANVTIAGESAGALSVLYLMAAPAARGLFAKAIAQSAYMISTPHLDERRHGMEPAEEAGRRLAATLDAPDLAALRAMDPSALAEAATDARFAPSGVVDGRILPRQLVKTFDRGEQAPVPVLAGYNSGEIRSLRFLAPAVPEHADAYETAIAARYGGHAAEFLSRYPAADMTESVLAATRDAMYGWSAERLAAGQAKLGQASYLYLFDHGWPQATKAGLHGFHAGEIPFVFETIFDTPPLWPSVPDTGDERRLADAMASYWTSFVAATTPSAQGEAPWPAYGEDRAFMRFAETPGPGVLDLRPFALHEEVVRERRAAGDTPWNWNVGIAAPAAEAGGSRP